MSANIRNSLYPVFLQLRGRKVVVVGGRSVAERKVRALLSAEARVHVVAPVLSRTLAQWVDEDRLSWHAQSFVPALLESAWLAIAATDDTRINGQVRDAAEQRHIWVNVVDDPALSAFHVPAIVDRSPVTIAVSSGGYAPVLSRRLRERVESLVDDHIGTLAGALGERREAIRQAYPDLTQRRHFYEWVLDGSPGTLLREGRQPEAVAIIDRALEQPMEWPRNVLTVIRAPDTDPGLLTLKALRALHQADALLYDPAVHAEAVLAMARRDAERIPIPLGATLQAEQSRLALAETVRAHGRVALLLGAKMAMNVDEEGLMLLSEALGALGIPLVRL